jgi:hypothetical protein
MMPLPGGNGCKNKPHPRLSCRRAQAWGRMKRMSDASQAIYPQNGIFFDVFPIILCYMMYMHHF